MSNHVMIYHNDRIEIYYVIKDKSFRLLEKDSSKPIKKMNVWTLVLATTIFRGVARSDVFHYMTNTILITWPCMGLVLGALFGVKAVRSKDNKLLNAQKLTLTKEDILSYEDKIEGYWDGIISTGIFSIFILIGMYLAHYKYSLLLYFMCCLGIGGIAYLFVYINVIYKFKLVKFVRKEKKKYCNS